MKSLLTPAEKAWLQNVIKPYRKWVVSIQLTCLKYKSGIVDGIIIYLSHPRFDSIMLPIDRLSNSYQFKGLEKTGYNSFRLETLGL